MMPKKRVYFFGAGKAEGKAAMKNLLGGKGANLAEMVNLGVPVPAGFTISTESCADYYAAGKKLTKALKDEGLKHLVKVEKAMGKKFGDAKDPLLLSVRSGARVSMPGMMDTVLNIGLNDTTIKGMIALTGNEKFCYDSYRRLLTMYGDVVMGVNREYFEEKLEAAKKKEKAKFDSDLSIGAFKALVKEYKAIIKKHTKKNFPSDPYQQLWGAVNAVFGSWDIPRAVHYRKMYNIPGDWGTAVNVQAMVFGNMGSDCGTGVAFTRDPATGDNHFYGEFLPNAQGEDVVAGIRTPQPINKHAAKGTKLKSMEEVFPKPYKDLVKVYKNLEKHYRDMLDLEFTIEANKLWMLQARVGKRTAEASVGIAVDMVKEKLITQKEAVMRVQPSDLDQLLHPRVDPKAKLNVLAVGLAASPGAAVGKVVFTADDAVAKVEKYGSVILVRHETSPEDIHGMEVAKGILTARGGRTSHAAVVARGMGKCCVAGCGDVVLDYKKKCFKANGVTIKEGDVITIDGSSGKVIKGAAPTIEPTLSGKFNQLMVWADKFRTLGVRTNADTPRDSKVARGFGAEGIGLCRTEHMFFEENRIPKIRQMILADDEKARRKALAKLLPMQRKDFVGIFTAMKGLPVTIRLLDPPLHEFLPHADKDIVALAKTMKVAPSVLRAKVAALSESNPMLGHRGCRLGVAYPEITEMQARAILEAAVAVKKKGIKVLPEIMIPLVGDVKELANQRAIVLKVADEVLGKKIKLNYMIGTMIELPRAALTADKIAEEAEFFSFGTNDLTQTTYGLSRDDSGNFLPAYLDSGIYDVDPFESMDPEGVGELVKIGVERGRKTRKTLKVGICGEHGGDPSSIMICHQIGLNYVSCSPYRVPIARLAAAHAALTGGKGAMAATV
jgi:pyruvate, orthophosphate dikinase